MISTYLELLGVFLIALFAFTVWPPLCLLVVGVAALLIAWQRERPARQENP